jgi:hypothetical protein
MAILDFLFYVSVEKRTEKIEEACTCRRLGDAISKRLKVDDDRQPRRVERT